MSQETHGLSPDPCADSLESEHLIPAQGEAAELLVLNTPVNGTSQDVTITGSPKSTSLPPVTLPVTRTPQPQNGIQFTPHLSSSHECLHKCMASKNLSSQQSSRVNSAEMEPPSLSHGNQEEHLMDVNRNAAELPNLNTPNNGINQEITEASETKSLPLAELPVTRPPQAQNGIRFTPHQAASYGSPQKCSGPKKLSSKQSSRVSSTEVEPPSLPPGAREDCCVHCALALLFCQFLSLCHLFLDVLTCGSCSADSAELCCSCCSMGACSDCSDSCSTDCGIVDACCESADCLEICMECCGLCFSS